MTYYYWDFDTDNVFLEEDENGNVIAEYTHEPGLYGELIAHERDGQVRYYNFDGQGSTRELTDENGDVTDTFTYTAFGEEVERTGSTVNPFRYKGAMGYYTNSDTNDIYVRARTYEPTIARWISRDPVILSGNRYGYVRNDPIEFNDPSGLYCSVAESEEVFSQPFRISERNGVLFIRAAYQYRYQFMGPCCFCCEYRRKISGHARIKFNGGPWVYPPIGGGAVPNPNLGIPVEDCDQRPDGTLECAGHRDPTRSSWPGPPFRLPPGGYVPNDWGCEYLAFDAPGMDIDVAALKKRLGNVVVSIDVDILFNFIDEIIDTCNENRLIEFDTATFPFNESFDIDLGKV